MDEKQLLKEIAYYSRYINEHQARNCNINKAPSARYKYVKKSDPPLPVIQTSTKVLINPNFKRSVHINPHFNQNTKIHINPKVLTTFSGQTTQKVDSILKVPNPPRISVQFTTDSPMVPRIVSHMTPKTSKAPQIAPHFNPKVLTPQIVSQFIPKPTTPQITIQFSPQTTNTSRTVSQFTLSSSNVFPTVNDPQKVIQFTPKQTSSKTAYQFTPKLCLPTSQFIPTLNNRKRRISIRSKYKIVKSTLLRPKSPLLKPIVLKNKYKIDRRSITTLNKSLIKKKMFKTGISDLVRNKLFRNRTWKNVTNNFKLNNTKIANISGVLYKKSINKLQKIQTTPNKSTNLRAKRYLLSLKGQKYILGSDKKTLKLVPNQSVNNRTNYRRISVKGITYVQKTSNTYIRAKTMSQSSIKKSKLNLRRKNNQPCPVYRRFGKCRRKDSGRCNFLHNPDQVFLCKKFLQGACLDDNCALSHKVSLEKMPTCKYFLEGCCVRSDCVYLHVKINPKAEICRKFLEGFCQDGAQCCKRHQFLCPNFERDQKCPRRKCIYPHKLKTDLLNQKMEQNGSKLPKYDNLNSQMNQAGSKMHKYEKDNLELLKTEPKTNQHSENSEQARYYADVLSPDARSAPSDKMEAQVSELAPKSPDTIEIDSELSKRPKLGILPQFIPFE